MLYCLISLYIYFVYMCFKKVFTKDDLVIADKFGFRYKTAKFFFVNREGLWVDMFFCTNIVVYIIMYFSYSYLVVNILPSVGVNVAYIYIYVYISTFVNLLFLYGCLFYLSVESVDRLDTYYWLNIILCMFIVNKYKYCLICYCIFIFCFEFLKLFFFKNNYAQYINKYENYFFHKKK